MARSKRKANLKRKRPRPPEAAGWLDQDGVHAVLPGSPADQVVRYLTRYLSADRQA